MPEIPTLVCLHGLGLSSRLFEPVAVLLGDRFDLLAIDLPGFGETPPSAGTSVEDMANHIVSVVRERVRGRWLLVGHSMGGKIATVVAARTLDGTAPVFGLAGVVLLAGSPPSPEPMSEEKRAEMLGQHSARAFIDANVGSPLPRALDAAAVSDFNRASPEAWRAWLQRGSREDWYDDVGALSLPALVLAGDADADLGAAAQPRINGPVYPSARFETLAGAGHLLPYERPAEVAAAITDFWDSRAGLGPVVPRAAAATIASGRTSARTRSALAHRALADEPGYQPQALTPAQLTALRAIADRVVPQDGPAIDLAARIDAQLAAGAGNGWRFADLPPDVEAYRNALSVLADFPTWAIETQDERLTAIAAGDGWLTRWFEDACDDLIRGWLAHPASLDRVGFDGYANGGDGLRLQGFTLLSRGEREAWEPVG